MSKKEQNGDKSAEVYFEEILAFVQDFADPVNESEFESNNPTKTQKSSSAKNNKLAKVVAKVATIEHAIFANKQTQKADIEKIFKLIGEKLNVDLYKFDIAVCVKFLKGYNSKKVRKINFSVQVILACILQSAKKRLAKWEIDVNQLYANVFQNENSADFEWNIKHIFTEMVERRCQCDKASVTKEQFFSTMYVFLLLSSLNNSCFDKFIIVLERTIAESMAEFDFNEKSKYVISQVPESLIEVNPKVKMQSLTYLYFGITDMISQLSKENIALTSKLNNNKSRIVELTSKVSELTAECEQKDKNIAALDNRISELNEQLVKANDRLEYEANMHDKQLSGLKTGIYRKIKKDLQLELEGIANFAKKLSPKESENLLLWMDNISQVFDVIGE